MKIGEVAELRGGFTMADVDRLAKVAAYRHGGATDYEDRYDAAWFGIVSDLYGGGGDPDERDLLWAGIRAVQATVDERNQAQGRSRRHGYEFGSAPAFGKFWNDAVVTPSHEDGVVEKAALAQVLATLSGEQYEALAAVAVCDTLDAAADALDLTRDVFLRRYYTAREQIRALWHEGETPRDGRATAEACGSSHPRSIHGRTGPTGHHYCQECQRLAKARRRARAAA